MNNVYVSSRNHGFDPLNYLSSLPVARIRQIHLAGHIDNGTYCIDTHDRSICADVWQLYEVALQMFGDIPTLLERDDAIPPLTELLRELDVVRVIRNRRQHATA